MPVVLAARRRDLTDSPSIVPDEIGDADVSALRRALEIIEGLTVYDDELNKWFLVNDDDPVFARVDGLLDHVRKVVRANTQSKSQGARSRDRQERYKERYVARARAYQKRRMDPVHCETSDSDLKALCGDRPVENPYFDPTVPVSDGNKRHLPLLGRRQAIKAIDEGLALIATGRFALSSR